MRKSRNKEGKLPSEIAGSNSDDEVKERSQTESSQTERDETDDNEVNKKEKPNKGDEERILYLPLYRAALAGDWKTVRRILKDDPDALTAQITAHHETLLQIAIISRSHSIQFVEELLNRMPPESLAITDKLGCTALSFSAVFGNTEAAKLLVEKNPELTQMRTARKNTPLHLAAQYGHKETVRYLLDVTQDKEPSPFSEESGVRMLDMVISADFYGEVHKK
ncbi:hypothetical protein L1049_011250 [Liquidambar formosana]|uniref:Uncharacterized protein n=1 Tax=Liquidambar formosana TaxID=63359 RepID=A0AAP0RR68_LIQFO